MIRRLSDTEHAYLPLSRPFRGCVFSEGLKGSSVRFVNSSRNESRSWGFLMVSLRTFLAKDDENSIFRGIENRLHGLFCRFIHLRRFLLSGKYTVFESSALFLLFNHKIDIISYFLDLCPGKLTELFIDKLNFGRFHTLLFLFKMHFMRKESHISATALSRNFKKGDRFIPPLLACQYGDNCICCRHIATKSDDMVNI
jgi:hypothetical protein